MAGRAVDSGYEQQLSAADAKKLANVGHRPGGADWDALGVFEYVTRPRMETVVTGTRSDGTTHSDGLAANVEFIELTYENSEIVEMDCAFQRIGGCCGQTDATGARVDSETSTGVRDR